MASFLINLTVRVDGDAYGLRDAHQACRLVERVLTRFDGARDFGTTIAWAASESVISLPADDVATAIRGGMATAFFATAYARQADEAGVALHGEITTQLPEMDPAAIRAADKLFVKLARANRALYDDMPNDEHGYAGIAALYAAHPGDLDPDRWGHYAAMQAMGHGVGLTDFDIETRRAAEPFDLSSVAVPEYEFDDLDRTYFGGDAE